MDPHILQNYFLKHISLFYLIYSLAPKTEQIRTVNTEQEYQRKLSNYMTKVEQTFLDTTIFLWSFLVYTSSTSILTGLYPVALEERQRSCPRL